MLPYYKRPKMVQNAIHSVITSRYSNWELHFIDDSGDNSYERVLYNSIDATLHRKVKYFPIGDSDEQKVLQGFSRHGEYMNKSIESTDGDITIILCDDDALMPNYLGYLNSFYQMNVDKNWSYCNLRFFDPSLDKYNKVENITQQMQIFNARLNRWEGPIHPACKVDSAQVSFRTKLFKESDIRYPIGQTENLDQHMLTSIFNYTGICYPNNIVGQVKGVFDDQLGSRIEQGRDMFEIKVK